MSWAIVHPAQQQVRYPRQAYERNRQRIVVRACMEQTESDRI